MKCLEEEEDNLNKIEHKFINLSCYFTRKFLSRSNGTTISTKMFSITSVKRNEKLVLYDGGHYNTKVLVHVLLK